MNKPEAALVLLAFVALVYLLMWWGWRRRGRKHDLPPLPPPPDDAGDARLRADGRYFGSALASDWLDRVVAQGLGNRSDCTLVLSVCGLDVHRPGLGSFRIPVTELRGARRDRGIAGKVIPPDGMLLVTWQHGDLLLDSGFKLSDGGHDTWVDAIDALMKEKQS
ncbi:MAG: hypothetical protein QM655_13570 [Nocardioidaceae bacterium]